MFEVENQFKVYFLTENSVAQIQIEYCTWEIKSSLLMKQKCQRFFIVIMIICFISQLAL